MSKLSDYSKFDHLDEYDSDTHEDEHQVTATDFQSTTVQRDNVVSSDTEHRPQDTTTSPVAMTRKDPVTGRYIFEYDGTKIYEWEQSLEEVNIYVSAPQGVQASQLICKISADRLQLGLRGSDRFFIDEETSGKVDTTESSWFMDNDDGVITIILIKVHRGETWESALKGQGLVDPVAKQEIQKEMLLERFQEENPGFDFRDADFSGSVPDPRTFMGGIKYS